MTLHPVGMLLNVRQVQHVDNTFVKFFAGSYGATKNFLAVKNFSEKTLTEGNFMSQERKIHITGYGRAAKSPDLVVLSLSLSAKNQEYTDAVTVGSQQVEMLRESIVDAGFDADDLKTTKFNVDTLYEREEFRDGGSKRFREIFVGFECRHELKLSFDFNNKKLSAVLTAITACLSQPKISVAFTVKDTAALSDALLKAAARDAKRKAKILCTASGVTLGKLLEINYAPAEISLRREVLLDNPPKTADFDFRPDDVTAEDSADFIWEIE